MTGSAGMIVTLGEVLVEIMAEVPGYGLRAPQRLAGPYPSGAPAIFIDQVARLGHPCGLIGCVGDDDFGRLNLDRLRADGVDVSAVATDPELPTGTAFVRYRPDGQRDFVFNIRHSASGRTRLTPEARDLLGRASHLHVMGSSLLSEPLIAAARDAVAIVRGQSGSVSFDPNVRKEILGAPGLREALGWMLRACDLFLPSGPELTLLTAATAEAAAVDEILGLGVGAVLVKRGRDGASYHDRFGRLDMGALPAREVDPTGAGDCFGATFVACRRLGMPPERSLRYAAASGAHAVECRGPMEGAAGFAVLDALIARAGSLP